MGEMKKKMMIVMMMMMMMVTTVISEMAMMTKTSMRKREIGGVEDDVVEMSRQCEGEGEILPPPLTGQFSSDF